MDGNTVDPGIDEPRGKSHSFFLLTKSVEVPAF